MRNWRGRPQGVWLETAVFLILFTLSITSLRHLSPTFDEQGFITRGLGYLRGENSRMRVGHPLGLNALSAALLVADDSVQLPLDDPSWNLPNFHRPSELFMWEIGNDVKYVIFLARLPTIWLGLLLTAVIGRWTWEITRKRWAVWLALGLAAFDPNLLAHMRLATTDFGLTAFAFLAGFMLWRFWQRPSWRRAIWAGVAFGLLQNTKFTAGLFVPLFAAVILLYAAYWLRSRPKDLPWLSRQSPILMLVVAYPVAAFLALWAAYGFQVGTLPDNLPILPQLAGQTLPLSHHLEQLLDIGGRLQKSTPAFLAGGYSDSGWWFYFPVAFLLKTPLPTLILLGLALVGLFWKRPQAIQMLTAGTLLIPALGYFAFALTTDINLGYRHILPTLPFFIVLTAVTFSWLEAGLNRRERGEGRESFHAMQVFGVGLVGWLMVSTLWLHPHYLAFFNGLAGGPNGGWRYLVDSNLDWGQDLENLKMWLDEHEVEHVWLSYFGEGRPSYYNINYTGLDSFPPRLMNPQARPFYPHDPAPGIYAISATTLQGVHFANHDTFAWFRDREPLDKVGYSIFLYEVPPRGEPADVVLAGVQLDEIAPADFAQFQTNQVIPRWLSSRTAFLQPAGLEYWLVAAPDFDLSLVGTAVSLQTITENDQYTIYRASFPAAEQQPGWVFSKDDSKFVLLDVPSGLTFMEDVLQLTTRWRNEGSSIPLMIYVHLLDGSGQIVAQWDGLDVAWEGWREDDTLWQQHQIALPTDLPPGEYEIRVGLYSPETAVRWQTASGADYLLLDRLVIGP